MLPPALALPRPYPYGHMEAREGGFTQMNPESKEERWLCCLGLISGGSSASMPRTQGDLGPEPPTYSSKISLSLPSSKIPKATETPSSAHTWIRPVGPRQLSWEVTWT